MKSYYDPQLGIHVKICSKCKQPKPAADFYRDPWKRDGLYSSCKECKASTRLPLLREKGLNQDLSLERDTGVGSQKMDEILKIIEEDESAT